MNENQFWIRLWTVIAIAAISLASVIVYGVTKYRETEMSGMLQLARQGISPIEVQCASALNEQTLSTNHKEICNSFLSKMKVSTPTQE